MAKKVKVDRRGFLKYSTIGILAVTGGVGVALSPTGAVAENRCPSDYDNAFFGYLWLRAEHPTHIWTLFDNPYDTNS